MAAEIVQTQTAAQIDSAIFTLWMIATVVISAAAGLSCLWL